MKLRLFLVPTLVCFFWSEILLSAQNATVQRLMKWISGPDPVSPFDFDLLALPSMEAGTDAIPALLDFLDRQDEPNQRMRAFMALAWVGGESATAMIQKEREKGLAGLEWLLAFVLPSKDSPENRELLIELLQRSPSSPSWNSTNTLAAWSLGILRAEEAVESLRAATQLNSAGWNSGAARDALFWIEHGNWTVDIPMKYEEDRMFAAILRTGIPGVREEQYYKDGNHGGYLYLDSSGWTFTYDRFGGKDSRTIIRFDASPSSERTRAIVGVSVQCEGNCGTAYTYLLRKGESGWQVQSIKIAGAW